MSRIGRRGTIAGALAAALIWATGDALADPAKKETQSILFDQASDELTSSALIKLLNEKLAEQNLRLDQLETMLPASGFAAGKEFTLADCALEEESLQNIARQKRDRRDEQRDDESGSPGILEGCSGGSDRAGDWILSAKSA